MALSDCQMQSTYVTLHLILPQHRERRMEIKNLLPQQAVWASQQQRPVELVIIARKQRAVPAMSAETRLRTLYACRRYGPAILFVFCTIHFLPITYGYPLTTSSV